MAGVTLRGVAKRFGATLVQNIIAVVADNNLNPRRSPTDHAWGKAAFLSVNPFFLKVDDARWYFRTLLRDEFLEPYNP